jgi:hypothetical protein
MTRVRHRIGMIGGETERSRRAPVVADHDEAVEAEMLAHQLPQIVGDRALVVAARGTRRIPEAAQVGRDE